MGGQRGGGAAGRVSCAMRRTIGWSTRRGTRFTAKYSVAPLAVASTMAGETSCVSPIHGVRCEVALFTVHACRRRAGSRRARRLGGRAVGCEQAAPGGPHAPR